MALSGMGFALGGAVDSIRAQRETALQKRSLDIQEAGQKQEADLKTREGLQASAKGLQDNINTIIENAKTQAAAGKDPQKVLQAYLPLIERVDRTLQNLGQTGGFPVQDNRSRLEAAMATITTPQEKGAAAGQQSVGEAEAIASGLSDGGKKVTTMQVAEARGLVPATASQPRTDPAKLVFDEQLIVDQFGKDSQQHEAFKKYQKESQGGASLSDVSTMRNQYFQQSGDFLKVRDAFNKIAASSQEPSAAGDLALIFNYMKLLDPGSVVREGEFATAQSAAGVPDRIRNVYNRLLSGERLAEGQRMDFVNQSEIIFRSQITTQLQLEAEMRGIALRSGINPNDAVPDLIGQNFRAASPSPNASDVPEGSQLIGETGDGGKVYETPDGRRVVVEPYR